tara:strand:+ start:1604 stop:2320 length:717 start_codon:yes stop_codon:yes gene_type:complete
MLKDGIHNIVASELILRASEVSNNVVSPTVDLANTDNIVNVYAGYVGALNFNSSIPVMPVGYSVVTGSHIISSTGTAGGSGVFTSVGVSTVAATTPTISVTFLTGETYVVNTTVDITDGTTTLTLTNTYTINVVDSMLFGVKAYEGAGVVTSTSLSEAPSTDAKFDIVGATVIGRLYIVLPTALVTATPLLSVEGPSGLIFPISDFTSTVSGTDTFYVLNYDTELTGTGIKNFILNYA